MRLIAFAVAGLVTVGAGAASAQPMWAPEGGRFYGPDRAPRWQRDMGPIDPRQVAYVVESMGLDPVGPPLQTGHLVVQRATDEFGRAVRVTVNMYNGRVVSVAPLGAPPAIHGGPYAVQRSYGPGPYAPGPYARQMPDTDDEDEFAPPGSMMAPRAHLPPGPSYAPGPGAAAPPRAATAATPYPTPAYPANPQAVPRKPATKSATATPTQPPKPRKRPEGIEAAKKAEPGSVAPVKPAPAPVAAPAAPSTAMPPVAPLE